MKYHKLVRCLNCHYAADWAPHGADFENSFNHLKFCGFCGKQLGWYDSVEVWTDTGVWWKPWTWGSGYLEKVKP